MTKSSIINRPSKIIHHPSMINKSNLFIHDVGSGLPLVLIHGYPLNHLTWENQFILSDEYRIIAPDLPGFGKSQAVDGLRMEDYAYMIAALLDEKKIDKAVVMGHSMGGYISLSFAERHENRLLGLGLICSQAGADTEEGKDARLKNAERVEKEGLDFIIEAMSEKLLSPKHNKNKSELNTKLRLIMKVATVQGVISVLKAMAARKDQFETLRELSVPVFIAAGKEDLLIPSDKSIQMADASKHPTFVTFAECGHMAMMENPGEFNLVLKKFINKSQL